MKEKSMKTITYYTINNIFKNSLKCGQCNDSIRNSLTIHNKINEEDIISVFNEDGKQNLSELLMSNKPMRTDTNWDVLHKEPLNVKSTQPNIKVDELIVRVNELTQKNDELMRKNERLEQKNDELTIQVNEVLQKNKELTIKIDELTRKNDELTRKNDELTRKNDELTIKNEELTKKVDELLRKNDELIKKVDELTQKNDELNIKVNNLTLQVSDLSDIIRDELIEIKIRNTACNIILFFLGEQPKNHPPSSRFSNPNSNNYKKLKQFIQYNKMDNKTKILGKELDKLINDRNQCIHPLNLIELKEHVEKCNYYLKKFPIIELEYKYETLIIRNYENFAKFSTK